VHEFAKQSGPVRCVNPIEGILPVLASLTGLKCSLQIQPATSDRFIAAIIGHRASRLLAQVIAMFEFGMID
jgi:hypothetical protein